MKPSQSVWATKIQWIVLLAVLISIPLSVSGQEIQDSSLITSDSIRKIYNGLIRQSTVIDFYRDVNNKLVWSDHDKLTVLADSMISFINNVKYFGLLPKNYHQLIIEFYKDYTLAPNRFVHLDVLLTDAFLSLAKDLAYGRTNTSVEANNDSLRILVLKQVINGASLLKNIELLEPKFQRYKDLKQVLKMRLDALPPGYLQRSEGDRLTDSTRLLNEIESIEVNLERWRWETQLNSNDLIYVNIPSFFLQVISNDKIVMTSRVIVGSPDHPTPTLNSTVDCIVTYPYWTVPRKISIEEYLPIIQKDTSFISRNNFEILDRKGKVLNSDSLDWSKFNKDYFPIILRQREGDENSLGIIKFVFDNPYAVYLHDTNAKWLFNNESRAYSHGCVRVEKSIELAHYLVTGDMTKKSKEITSFIDQKQRNTVELKKGVPLYIRYFTYEVEDNRIQKYTDIYNLDQKLLEVLYQ